MFTAHSDAVGDPFDDGGRRLALNPQPASPDDTLVLVCVNCARVVVFGPDGWAHGDGSAHCPMLVVAWPPPGSEDETPTTTPSPST